MPEPHATTVGIIVGSGIGLAGGTIMGAQVDALLLGLVAAIIVSIWMPAIDDRLKAASAVALSSLLAGYGSPVAAGWLAVVRPGFSDDDGLRLLAALLIGALAPVVVPVATQRVQALVRGRPE